MRETVLWGSNPSELHWINQEGELRGSENGKKTHSSTQMSDENDSGATEAGRAIGRKAAC